MESVKQWVESVLFDELWALVTVPLVSSSHSAMPVTSVYQVAAAAAKSLQSCPTLCDPIDGSPPGPIVPGILQARTLEWVAISSSNAWEWKVKVKELSCVQLLATSWTAAYQAPPSMGFSRQEYWSGEIEMRRQTVFLMVEEARHSLITPTFPGREIPWSRAFLLILRCTLCCEGQVGKLKLFLPSWVCVFSGLELFTQTSEKDVLIYWWLSKSMFCGEDDRKFLFAILLIWQILLQ